MVNLCKIHDTGEHVLHQRGHRRWDNEGSLRAHFEGLQGPLEGVVAGGGGMMQEDQEEEEPRVAERALGQLLVSRAHQERQRLDWQPQDGRCDCMMCSRQGISNLQVPCYGLPDDYSEFNVVICSNMRIAIQSQFLILIDITHLLRCEQDVRLPGFVPSAAGQTRALEEAAAAAR